MAFAVIDRATLDRLAQLFPYPILLWRAPFATPSGSSRLPSNRPSCLCI